MSTKIITDVEMAQIIHDAVNKDLIDDSDQYRHFLGDLGILIADHFGGFCGNVHAPEPEDTSRWACAFHHNECVPDNGGVYAKYDPDVTWLAKYMDHED